MATQYDENRFTTVAEHFRSVPTNRPIPQTHEFEPHTGAVAPRPGHGSGGFGSFSAAGILLDGLHWAAETTRNSAASDVIESVTNQSPFNEPFTVAIQNPGIYQDVYLSWGEPTPPYIEGSGTDTY